MVACSSGGEELSRRRQRRISSGAVSRYGNVISKETEKDFERDSEP